MKTTLLALTILAAAGQSGADLRLLTSEHFVWRSADGRLFAEAVEQREHGEQTSRIRQIVASPERNHGLLSLESIPGEGRFLAHFWDQEAKWWAELEIRVLGDLPATEDLASKGAFEWSAELAASDPTLVSIFRTPKGEIARSSKSHEDLADRVVQASQRIEIPETSKELVSFLRHSSDQGALSGPNLPRDLLDLLLKLLAETSSATTVAPHPYAGMEWEVGQGSLVTSRGEEPIDPARLGTSLLEDFGELPAWATKGSGD